MDLFGRKKRQAAPKLSDSIIRLRATSVTLDKTEVHLQKKIRACIIEAKKRAAMKDKRSALFQLKRKKMLEKQLDQIFGKKTNLEMQILALENAASNKEIFNAMVEGKEALNRAVNVKEVENMEDVMEDITESLQMVDEMGEALSRQIGPPVDEDELEAEFAELMDEIADEEMLSLDTPMVPQHEIQVPEKDLQTSIKTTEEDAAAAAEKKQLQELMSF